MVCALEAHNSEPSLKRKRAALLLEHRFAKKQHTMATCATHCDGQEWCSVSMRNYAMWITEIAQHVHSSFASGVLYSGVVDRRLGDPSTYQVMVVETEAGLRNGLAMLEESTTDKVMAMDLVCGYFVAWVWVCTGFQRGCNERVTQVVLLLLLGIASNV